MQYKFYRKQLPLPNSFFRRLLGLLARYDPFKGNLIHQNPFLLETMEKFAVVLVA